MRSTQAHTTVRLTTDSRAKLRALARAEQRPMQAVLDGALEQYRRSRFLEAVNAGYAAVHADPRASASLRAEQEAWEATLEDGLPDETWADAGEGSTSRPRRRRRR
jgi:predicted transcriptional regulator